MSAAAATVITATEGAFKVMRTARSWWRALEEEI
jgi:hypothetical protein